MGHYDPLDGFVTFSELRFSSGDGPGRMEEMDAEIAGMAWTCRGMNLATDDLLGLGGLLADVSRLAELTRLGGTGYEELLESVLASAAPGIRSFAEGNALAVPADYRLAFRELGLAIGLEGLGPLRDWIATDLRLSSVAPVLDWRIRPLMAYVPVAASIEEFWMDPLNLEIRSWRDHREINIVMLATALAPERFLAV